MDSLTQAVLGAAVGHAVAGRRLGRRAALWGAVAGTLPDLDVLASPLLDEAGALRFHRGLTHGLAFAFVAGPVLGAALLRVERWRARGRPDRDAGSWPAWTAVLFWGLLTHPLLDVFTVYGTQLLAPFSARPFAIGSVFIIDPLYTVPLAASLAVALVRRQPRWAVLGLALSTAYLGWGAAAQHTVRQRAEARFPTAERRLVTPAPLQTVLWRVEVAEGGRVASYQHTLLKPGVFRADGRVVPIARFAPGVEAARGVQTLRWFSQGWLVRPDSSAPGVVADARFGRGPGGAHVFRWRVGPDGRFEPLPFDARLSAAALRDLARDATDLRP